MRWDRYADRHARHQVYEGGLSYNWEDGEGGDMRGRGGEGCDEEETDGCVRFVRSGPTSGLVGCNLFELLSLPGPSNQSGTSLNIRSCFLVA